MSGSLTRITEALCQAEAGLSAALAASCIGVWQWDLDTNVLTWDKRMFDLYETQLPNWVPDYSGFINCVHPADIPSVNHAIDRAVNHGEPYLFNFRVKTRDGGWKHITGRGGLMDTVPGRKGALVGVCYTTDK